MERIDRIRQQERIVRLVAGALASGVVVIGLVAYAAVRSGMWTPMDSAIGAIVLYAGVGVTVVGLLVTPVLDARLRASLSRLPEDEVIQRYAASIIVPQAIREGVGLMGIVAGLLAGAETWILIFAAASVASQVVSFPRVGDLENRLDRRPGPGA